MSISRRVFLGSAATAVILTGRTGSSFAASAVDRIPIGLELYTVDSAMKQDFDGTLRRVAALGYREVEFPWYHGRSARRVLQSLAAAGLKCRSGLITEQELTTDLPARIDFAHTLGLKYLGHVMMDLPGGEGADVAEAVAKLSLDDFKRTAELLNRTGEKTRAAGIQLTYHNHNFEFVKFGDVVGYNELLRLTDPQYVKMEMDVGWVAWAGYDPARYLREHPGRFALLHVRDFKRDVPYRMLEMHSVEVGRGVIDWKELLTAARISGVEIGFVEQDPGAIEGSLASAKASLAYLRALAY